MNTEYVMQQMWATLLLMDAGERKAFADKLIRREKLSFDEQISFEAAFHIAYNMIHGED